MDNSTELHGTAQLPVPLRCAALPLSAHGWKSKSKSRCMLMALGPTKQVRGTFAGCDTSGTQAGILTVRHYHVSPVR